MNLYYDSCDECKRLIAMNPYANANTCNPQYTIIEGRKVCWECTAKLVAKRGTVPYRQEWSHTGNE